MTADPITYDCVENKETIKSCWLSRDNRHMACTQCAQQAIRMAVPTRSPANTSEGHVTSLYKFRDEQQVGNDRLLNLRRTNKIAAVRQGPCLLNHGSTARIMPPDMQGHLSKLLQLIAVCHNWRMATPPKPHSMARTTPLQQGPPYCLGSGGPTNQMVHVANLLMWSMAPAQNFP